VSHVRPVSVAVPALSENQNPAEYLIKGPHLNGVLLEYWKE